MKTRNDPTVMKLAAEAECDPRSAMRALNGEPVRGRAGEKIRAAAVKLKIKLPKETR